MTLDDLGNAYEDAWFAAMRKSGNPRQAGIAAVVRALRDYFDETFYEFTDKQLKEMFNNILGSDAGNEKAAGGEAVSGDGLTPRSSMPASTPAADPKVCVWTRTSKWTDARRGCDGSLAFWDYPYAPDKCIRCDKPVKFQEQQP